MRVRGEAGCAYAAIDGHLEPTNASVPGLKWPPTHYGGLCSSRRRRALLGIELTASVSTTARDLLRLGSSVISATIELPSVSEMRTTTTLIFSPFRNISPQVGTTA